MKQLITMSVGLLFSFCVFAQEKATENEQKKPQKATENKTVPVENIKKIKNKQAEMRQQLKAYKKEAAKMENRKAVPKK